MIARLRALHRLAGDDSTFKQTVGFLNNHGCQYHFEWFVDTALPRAHRAGSNILIVVCFIVLYEDAALLTLFHPDVADYRIDDDYHLLPFNREVWNG